MSKVWVKFKQNNPTQVSTERCEDEKGSLFISKEYQLNPDDYVKEGFDRIYRLVYYVVNKSHLNSPRTTPSSSSVSIS